MILLYNGVDLATLGVLQILGSRTQREPVEAPQRERVTLQVRLDFFETAFVENASLVAQVRSALTSQQTQLLFQDGNGSNYLNRTVTVGDDEEPGDGRALAGGTRQALVFSFWYLNHNVATNCLSGTYQAAGANTTLLNLGAVEQWEEKLDREYFDKLRPNVRLVTGAVTASGRFQANTAQVLGTAGAGTGRRDLLLQTKDALIAAIVGGSQGTLNFGSFNQVVRVTAFTAKVNQPMNYIEWTLTVTFTRWPNEADYAICEYKVAHRVTREDGVDHLTIAGRILAPTLPAAQTKLGLITGSLVPAGYMAETSQQDGANVQSVTTGGVSPDGVAFIELSFTLEWRDTTTLTITWQRPGGQQVNLGVVDKFSDRYQGTLFDEMRDVRKRAGGLVALEGFIPTADSLTLAQKQAALTGLYQLVMGELQKGGAGLLTYQAVLAQNVRVLDFNAVIDRWQNKLRWTLSASYTKYPDESNYAVCEFRVATKEDKALGTVTLSLTGTIGAPNATAALATLAAIRTAQVPAGFVLMSEDPDQQLVSSASDAGGDGQAFTKLTFADEWRKTSGSVVGWVLRIAADDDLKAGYLRTTYSGTVQAYGANRAAAYAAAAAQAAALGAGQLPFLIRSSVKEDQRLFLTSGGNVFSTVEFSYEYQTKGARIFLEVTSELSAESFGRTTETASGFIMAPTLAAAQTVYQTYVKGLPAYANVLLLNERTPALANEAVMLDPSGTGLQTEDGRFAFSFQVYRAKTLTTMKYSLSSASDIQANTTLTTIKGTCYAPTDTAARTTIESFVTGLNAANTYGNRVRTTRTPEYEAGNNPAGTAAPLAFISMAFEDVYEGLFNFNGILETECAEEVTYAGPRLVNKPVPDGIDIIQSVGTACGSRVVTASATGTVEAGCRAYVAGLQSLLTGAYAQPPKVKTDFKFLSQVQGVPRGTGANPKLVVVTGTFSELLPATTYAG